jgi:hypothetical protein
MDGKHTVAHAQLPRREIDQRDVAAMAVDDDELLHAGATHALADLNEGAQRGFGRQRERARIGAMLVRCADRLHRQDHHAGARQQRAHAREIGLRDVGIDPHGEMRPVLLHRGDGKHRDAIGKLFRRELKPVGHASLHVVKDIARKCHKFTPMFTGSPAFAGRDDRIECRPKLGGRK